MVAWMNKNANDAMVSEHLLTYLSPKMFSMTQAISIFTRELQNKLARQIEHM